VPTTRLCEALGIEQPILSVGMGPGAGAELAAAVSNAGGLGVIGGGSSQAPEFTREQIERTRGLTDRPFGVNIIIDDLGMPEWAAVLRERFDAIVEHGIPLLVLFAGDPAPYVDPAHAAGTKVMIQVGSPEEARRAVDAGVDFAIAQGYEAGGHVIARTSLFVNLPAIVDAVAPVPVLASGGIADGRGLAAALMLGAQGVSLGTRFLASDEAFARDDYKRRLIDAAAEDTFYSETLFEGRWPNVPHRTIKARTFEEWDAAGRPVPGSRPHEGEPIGVFRRPWDELEIQRYDSFMMTPWFEGDVELGPLWAGESVELVHDIRPAGEIVREIAREADEVLARCAPA
jgi:NAD(P)H-dependent flavin oxidoreductase YrpB (nitropropane dioxygenase family)